MSQEERSKFTSTPVLTGLGEAQFGIENEFNVRGVGLPPDVDVSGLSDYDVGNLKLDYTYAHMATALANKGFNTAFKLTSIRPHVVYRPKIMPFPPFPKPLGSRRVGSMVYMSGTQLPSDPQLIKVSKYWVVKHEVGLGDTAPSEYAGWVPAELNTRIMEQQEAEGAFRSVKTAIRTLHESVGGAMHINPSCGLHVHVSPTEGMAARHMQRLASMLIIIEWPLLFRLVATHRQLHQCTAAKAIDHYMHWIGGPESEDKKAAVIRTSDMYEDIPVAMIREHIDRLVTVWDMQTPLDFESMFSRMPVGPGEQCTVAFRDHGDSSESQYSLEFRHAQASMSASFVDCWVKLVLAIFRTIFMPPYQFKRVMTRLWAVLHGDRAEDQVWSHMLHVFNDEASGHWKGALDIGYWQARLASDIQRRSAGMDVDDDQLVVTS